MFGRFFDRDPGEKRDLWSMLGGDTGEQRSMRRSEQPEDYAEAPGWYVKGKFRGQRHKPVNLARDVAALDQGAELIEDEEFWRQVKEVTQTLPEEDRDDFTTAQAAARAFVETVDLDKVSTGGTPIERAINYMLAMAETMKQTRDKGAQSTDGGEDAMPSEFEERGAAAGKEWAERLNKAWEQVSQMSAEEVEDLDALGDKGFGLGWDKSKENPDYPKIIATLLSQDLEQLLDTVATVMKERREVKVKTEIDFYEEPGGKQVKARSISGIHEIPMMATSDRAKMSTNQRMGIANIVTGKAQVMPRGEKYTKKQLAYVVVDVSGSMWSGAYRPALAIMKNRLEAAVRGEADLRVAMFATGISEFREYNETTDPDQARMKSIRHWMENANVGGGTDIPLALETALKEIKEGWDKDKYALPEILIVTDGICGGMYSLATNEENFKTRDGRTIRLNTFMINVGHGGAASVMQEIYTKRYRPWEYNGAGDIGHSTVALPHIADKTGGGVWFVDPRTGEPIPQSQMSEAAGRDVRYNPYGRTW